ncbi:MAG: DUF1549 and DUF1553 domain-containing protein [Verrucomicrobiales bacterium]|nr:DUF1549 and DUF1553 domain-containing protein [Verrucomicrobiales bacterium]
MNLTPSGASRRIIGSMLFAGAFAICAYAEVKPTESPATSLLLHFTEAGAPDSASMLRLTGRDARQQLLVTATLQTGQVRDFTRRVKYEVSPADIVQVDHTGLVTPLRNGVATVAAKSADGLAATLPVTVEGFDRTSSINFPNQIVPIFTKTGCNGGGCHGKSAGQNGFRLSLLGFEPAEDYEHLVKEARGRRLFPAAPDRSLLLLKGAATLPHGGGKRLDPDSDDYRLIVRWIRQGMPYGEANAPTVDRIEVFPKERTMPLGGEQQLVITARYTDGSTEDVTRSALYEPNDKDMAKVDEHGYVELFQQPGDVAVMVRYQAKVAVFRATIPLGAPIENLPPARNFVDEIVFKKLKTIGIPPSAICDDATFIRRATIDIAGRLPTPTEVEQFLAEMGGGKAKASTDGTHESVSLSARRTGGEGRGAVGSDITTARDLTPAQLSARDHLIDRLLESTDYADYFANKWAALLRNKRTDPKHARGTYAFHDWVRDSFVANKPFDQFVSEILTASGDMAQNPPVAWYRQVKETTAQLEDTAQLFLGMRLQCAQCHHHPYEKWSQQDYYRFAAFFSRIGRKAGSQPGEEIVFHKRGKPEATNKKTKQPEKPAGLGSSTLPLSPDDDPRQALAQWMTDKNNPYFARSLVNRYWKHFFNRGLVEPEDDMRETNPATNPELLSALATRFVESGYDLKELIRTLTRSQVYQLSAIPNQHNAVDKQNFSRYYPKRLTAEVLFDAVNQVTLAESKFDGLPVGTRAVQLPDNGFNASSYFLTVFGRPESSSACECERSQDASLAQSLHLLNSKDIQDKLTNDKARAALLAKDEKRSDEAKIRDLYRLAYAREPETKEIETARSYIEKKAQQDAEKGKRLAYEDMVWALVNTKEFLFNH